MRYFILFLSLGSCVFANSLFAYDFSVVRQDLFAATQHLFAATQHQTSPNKAPKIAVFFDPNLAKIASPHLDLVHLKQSLLEELVQDFLVVDPFHLESHWEKQSNDIQQQNITERCATIATAMQLEQYVFVSARQPAKNRVLLGVTLFGKQSGQATFQVQNQFQYSFPAESVEQGNQRAQQRLMAAETVAPGTPTQQKAEPATSHTNKQNIQLIQADFEDYSSSSSLLNALPFANLMGFQGDPWTYFHPSAFVQPAGNGSYIDFSLGISNWETVDINAQAARAEWTYDIFQVGISANTEQEIGFSTAYANAKVLLLQEQTIQIPLFLALGLKQRLYLADDAKQFVYPKDAEKAQQDEDLDFRSFFLAADYRIDSYGTIISGYVDNLYAGLDAKIYTNARVALYLGYWSLYKTDHNLGVKEEDTAQKFTAPDFSGGVEFIASDFFSLGLYYQRRTEATVLGLKFFY